MKVATKLYFYCHTPRCKVFFVVELEPIRIYTFSTSSDLDKAFDKA